MRPENRQLLYFYIAQVISMVLAVCPKNALDQFQQCTTKVLPDLSQNSLSQEVKDASQSCRDSRLNDATDCIKDILDRCNGNSKDEVTLRRLVDKDKTLETVDYFCKNIRVYEKNAECIFRHHEEVNTCSQNAMKTFTSKINSGASMEVLMSESCRFHSTARSCLTKTTELRCGQEAAQFVFRLLTGTLPPHCDSDEENSKHTPRDGSDDKSKYTPYDGSDDNPKYTPYDGGRSVKRHDDGDHYGGHNAARNILPSITLLALLLCLVIGTLTCAR